MFPALDLFERLTKNARRFDFFQALRLIENAYPDKPRIGEALRPRDDVIRFGQDPELIFHPTTLGYFNSSGKHKPRLVVNFFGVYGANAPLPIHMTEYVRDRQRNHNDATLVAFTDIFHHRLISLFYRAHAVTNPCIARDRPQDDRFGNYIGSLCGLGAAAFRQRDGLPGNVKLSFSGLLANQRRHAGGLANLLSTYFGVPVVIEQFVGQWIALPRDECTHVGQNNHRLGRTTLLGQRVWDCQTKFRIHFGPLSLRDYLRLSPGSASMARLIDWVRQYCGLIIEWDVRLVLRKEDIPKTALGHTNNLGKTSWIVTKNLQNIDNQLIFKPFRTYAKVN